MAEILQSARCANQRMTLEALQAFEDMLDTTGLTEKLLQLGVQDDQVHTITAPFIACLCKAGYPKEQAVLMLNHLAKTKAYAPRTSARMR